MEVIVEETGEGRFSERITVGKHVLAADEPVSSGGKDKGPSPYDFILAALGSCTCMTVRMYADLKKIPLQKICVKLTYQKDYALDCRNCEKDDARIDSIYRVIELEGELSEEQRKKLLEISNKCPVHRSLTSKIAITTALAK